MPSFGAGFTLIELLVVIAIIGILASIVLASLNTARVKSRDGRRIADLKQMQIALALFYEANQGSYPTDIYAASGGLLDGCANSEPCMPVAPKDPIGQTHYSYTALSDTSGGTACNFYHLGASFENPDNQALNNDADMAASPDTCTGFVGSDFDGSDGTSPSYNKCNAADVGIVCYDVRP